MKHFSIIAMAFAGVLFASCSSSTNAPGLQVSSQDQSFVTFAAQSSNSEIAAADIALSNSSNSSIQQFAQKMVTDHTTANEKLAAVTSVRATIGALPTTPLPNEAAIAAQLATMTGTTFDVAYVNDQVNGHITTIAQYQQEIDAGSASDIKSYAQAQLPILQMHLQMAQQLQTALGGTTPQKVR